MVLFSGFHESWWNLYKQTLAPGRSPIQTKIQLKNGVISNTNFEAFIHQPSNKIRIYHFFYLCLFRSLGILFLGERLATKFLPVGQREWYTNLIWLQTVKIICSLNELQSYRTKLLLRHTERFWRILLSSRMMQKIIRNSPPGSN